jgi:hypothetical protein
MSMYVQPYSQRIIAGVASSISWQQIGGDGEPADPGTVTVTITRADGTAVATTAATTGAGTAARTYALSVAQTAPLDRLTAVWQVAGTTVATTDIDVVAGPWFSNADLRADQPSLAGVDKYPAALITIARLQTEAFIERVTGRRFVPGYDLVTLPGSYRFELVLPNVEIRAVRSAKIYNDPSAAAISTLGATELAAIPYSKHGVITRYSASWAGQWVKIGYEYGFVAPPPDVKAAGMRLCREVLEKSKTTSPDAAVSWNSTDLGWSAVFVTPGVRGMHTSIPKVNEVLDAWTFTEVGVA